MEAAMQQAAQLSRQFTRLRRPLIRHMTIEAYHALAQAISNTATQ